MQNLLKTDLLLREDMLKYEGAREKMYYFFNSIFHFEGTYLPICTINKIFKLK